MQSLIIFRDRWFMPFTNLVSHKWKWLNVGTFLILLMVSVSLLKTGILPLTFFPYLDDDIQLIRAEFEPGTPADTTKARLLEIEKMVWQVNEKLTSERDDGQQVVRNIELLMGPNSHQGQLRVVMLGGEQRGIPAFELNNQFREASGQVSGARYVRFLGATAEQRFGGLPVEISVSGTDLNQIQLAAARLKKDLELREDLVDVADTDQRGNPELHIKLNRTGEQLGLTLHDVMSQVRFAFFGLEVQNLQRSRDDVRVWIRFDDLTRSSYHELVNLNIRTHHGAFPLGEIASIHPTNSNLEVSRINGRRSIRVDADLADPSFSAPAILGEIESNILPAIKADYPGVQFFIEGQNREAGLVTVAMKKIAPVIIVLILALIVINFQSFTQTIMVLFSLPFAFVGVVIGHVIHGVTMNIFSVIGMIALVGILINNMLVLISAFNDNLRADMNFEEALKDAIQSRFRPILLTTLSTVVGLIPMIFMGGLASAFLQPPAIAIAYGLIFGLFITLTLNPAFLVIWNTTKLKLIHLIGRTDQTQESIEPAVQLKKHHKRSIF